MENIFDSKEFVDILPILRRQYDKAICKHREFPGNVAEAVCIIAEEFGELAKEVNDHENGWEERALIESTHVAVTAIRTMEMIFRKVKKEREKEWNL